MLRAEDNGCYGNPTIWAIDLTWGKAAHTGWSSYKCPIGVSIVWGIWKGHKPRNLIVGERGRESAHSSVKCPVFTFCNCLFVRLIGSPSGFCFNMTCPQEPKLIFRVTDCWIIYSVDVHTVHSPRMAASWNKLNISSSWVHYLSLISRARGFKSEGDANHITY